MHPAITQVWKQNFEAEISRLDGAFFNYRVISIDAESPGFIRDTPRDLSAVLGGEIQITET
jgi:CCR4-NOT transcription complex subunit 7/8